MKVDMFLFSLTFKYFYFFYTSLYFIKILRLIPEGINNYLIIESKSIIKFDMRLKIIQKFIKK